jgi:hypothetical protein
MLEGNVRHRDSLGNVGVIRPGDVQWMTSGRGILHEEMPKRGPNGNVNGFQLWVNLPARLKMSQPRYQEIGSKIIPTMEVEGAKVRVVAGEYGGMQGPVTEIAARPLYMDVSLEPGAAFHMPVPQEHAVYVYIFEGEAAFERDGDAIGAVSMVVYGEGESLRVKASPETKARFLMMAGAPIKEPIVPYGPFVMNTQEEIQQAFIDLQNGTFVQG